mmetsp:Transcript_5900/g.14103  ORF Transcript_5900/g.14103 Transcript_5900/m.14103 type:complete len:269 (+) Transcript_5900:1026-1832(+)
MVSRSRRFQNRCGESNKKGSLLGFASVREPGGWARKDRTSERRISKQGEPRKTTFQRSLTMRSTVSEEGSGVAWGSRTGKWMISAPSLSLCDFSCACSCACACSCSCSCGCLCCSSVWVGCFANRVACFDREDHHTRRFHSFATCWVHTSYSVVVKKGNGCFSGQLVFSLEKALVVVGDGWSVVGLDVFRGAMGCIHPKIRCKRWGAERFAASSIPERGQGEETNQTCTVLFRSSNHVCHQLPLVMINAFVRVCVQKARAVEVEMEMD